MCFWPKKSHPMGNRREGKKLMAIKLDMERAYTNDCILVARASTVEARAVNEVLQRYCSMSGQQVNIAKSQVIFGVDVHPRHRQWIKRALNMPEAQCPITYLGVPVGMKRLPISAFRPLLERIRTKLTAWKSRSLSFAGKISLVQTVLQSIPVYLLSSGWVPKSILEKIDGFRRKFLWSRDGDGCGLALSAWSGCVQARKMVDWDLAH